MIHPPTSVEAHTTATQIGTLKRDRVAVGLAFKVYGPGSAAEVLAAAGLDGNLNLKRARVTELEDLGLLRVVGRRACQKTGANVKVLEWFPSEPREKTFAVELTRTDLSDIENGDFSRVRLEILGQAARTKQRMLALLGQRSWILAQVNA